MTSLILAEPKELMAQHREALRQYARRVILQGESLASHEEVDKARRIEGVWAIHSSFKLTKKEVVTLIFKGFFVDKRGCGCPSCRARAAM